MGHGHVEYLQRTLDRYDDAVSELCAAYPKGTSLDLHGEDIIRDAARKLQILRAMILATGFNQNMLDSIISDMSASL